MPNLAAYRNTTAPKVYLLLLASILFIICLMRMVERYRKFVKRKKYYQTEIHRAATREEKEQWEKRLKRLYRSMIPIFNAHTRYAIQGFFHQCKKPFKRHARKRRHRHKK